MKRKSSFPTIFDRGPGVDVLFWLGYTLFWHLLFSPNVFSILGLLYSSIYTIWHAVASYVHVGVLMPRYQQSKRLIAYLIFTLAVTFAAGMGLAIGTGAFTRLWSDAGTPWFYIDWEAFFGPFFASTLMGVVSTGLLHLFIKRRKLFQRQRELEKANLEAELRFLRGQINPHFLFNALNTIYFMIPKNPEEAAETLAGFSDLLRYQLYRGEEASVSLEEEIAQLDRFAVLSRLRLNGELDYQFDRPVALQDYRVPPLLLLPLLENAFKYVHPESGYIRAQLSIEAENGLDTEWGEADLTAAASAGPDEQYKGIGLSNIRRRLELLYPDQHRLELRHHRDLFSVTLEFPVQCVRSAPSLSTTNH